MSNVLKIEGRKSPIVNAQLNVEAGIFLSALYNGEHYNLDTIHGLRRDGKTVIAVLRFGHEDRRYQEGRLNYIALATTFGGIYRATGVSHISKVDSRGTKFYPMGDDLEIVVDPSAEEAIESIKGYAREIEEAIAGRDIPRDYLGFPIV